MKKIIGIIITALLFSICPYVIADEYDDNIKEILNDVLTEENKTKIGAYVTRSEFNAVLMKYFKYTKDIYICSFYDVSEDDWDYIYVANAQHKKITEGRDGQFFGKDLITVQEAVTLLSRIYRIDNSDYIGEWETLGFKCSQYAKGYITYAIKNGIYPQENGNNINAEKYLTYDKAIKLFGDFARTESGKENSLRFDEGYPKVMESGRINSISFLLKVNKPCTVYYKIVEKDSDSEAIPKISEIDKMLVPISKAGYEIKASVEAKQNVRYNIYMALKTDDSETSLVYIMRDISPLPYTQGNGTKQAPYRIYTDYQLRQISNYPDKCFILCKDIDNMGTWNPACDEKKGEKAFSGVFDGNGYSIKNLKILGEDYVGFFSKIDGGTVKNLCIDAQVSATSYGGIIAGEVVDGVVQNCNVSGSVNVFSNVGGAVVGKNSGTVKNCLAFTTEVNTATYAGGVAGSNYGLISDCISCGQIINSGMYASSIAGVNIGGKVKNCLGANIEINDSFTKNSGRITTNKKSGTTENNYAYENMQSSIDVHLGSDTKDGEDATWSEITSQDFYEEKFNWNFFRTWSIENAPDFMLPCVRTAKRPRINQGQSVFSPKPIASEEELREIEHNLSGHYYLARDIELKKLWTPIGKTGNYDEHLFGFSGSFNGGGHTIYGLSTKSESSMNQYGLFGVLYGGTVRNLRLSDINVSGHTYVSGICAINYGIIENCQTEGKINAETNDRETVTGSISAVNYTNILNTRSKTDITVNSGSVTVGGISGQNEGFIYNCLYDAKIDVNNKKNGSIGVIGGISGINHSGMIYNCYAGKLISSNLTISYLGGICGIQNEGEIYKCSSSGMTINSPENVSSSVSYVGGIVAMSSGSIVMNSFSQCAVSSNSEKSYVGGIGGLFENSSIQNCYSINTLNQLSNDGYAGGIAGYCENTNIAGVCAINPYIMSSGRAAEICPYIDGGFCDNNYYCDAIFINSNYKNDNKQGKTVSLKTLKDTDFFFRPVENGGLLGWINANYYDGDVWTRSKGNSYPFPILYNVPNQNIFSMPKEFSR